jgi:hypothetical protein
MSGNSKMPHAANHKAHSSSLFGSVMARLSARIAPLVRAELSGALIMELERHFNERLLSELHERVKAIVARELEKREAVIDSVLSTKQASKYATTLADRFTQVFQENLWLDSETVSGAGSRKDSHSVVAAISALTIVKEKVNFTSINDIPCGDFNWIEGFLKCVPNVLYRGFDIVSLLIERNRVIHPCYEFNTLDITLMTPPYADLIFSKDLFNHLMYEDIRKALINMKRSTSRFLLASNNFGYENEDLPGNIGASTRYFDLCSKPLNLPPPIWNTYYMGLWKLSDIEIGD